MRTCVPCWWASSTTLQEAGVAIAASRSWSEAFWSARDVPRTGGAARRFGSTPASGELRPTISIPTPTFVARAQRGAGELEEILVEHSTFSRNHLKNRLYEEGLKQPVCELCGQGEALETAE